MTETNENKEVRYIAFALLLFYLFCLPVYGVMEYRWSSFWAGIHGMTVFMYLPALLALFLTIERKKPHRLSYLIVFTLLFMIVTENGGMLIILIREITSTRIPIGRYIELGILGVVYGGLIGGSIILIKRKDYLTGIGALLFSANVLTKVLMNFFLADGWVVYFFGGGFVT